MELNPQIFRKIKVGLINTKFQNFGSIINLFDQFNIQLLDLDKNNYKKFDLLLIPGVGRFDHLIRFIKKNKLINGIEYNFFKKKILGICLGMQIIFEESEEAVHEKGLGFEKGNIVKIDKNQINIGWSKLENKRNIMRSFTNQDYFYFVHSYHVNSKNDNFISSKISFNNQKLTATYTSKNFIGTQFHPEKSSHSGIKFFSVLFDKWL